MSNYALPQTPCDARHEIKDINITDEHKCGALNPDKVYQKLFPGYATPMDMFNNEDVKGISQIKKEIYSLKKHECASECLNNKNPACITFEYEKDTKVCKLYNKYNNYTCNKFFNKQLTQTDINTANYSNYEKVKNDSSCPSKCSINDSNFFKKCANGSTTAYTTSISSPVVSDLAGCQSACKKNPNCHFITYINPKSKCRLYNNHKKDSVPSNIKTFVRNNEPLSKFIGNPSDNATATLEKNYRKYKYGEPGFNGIPGDYICDYNKYKKKCEKVKQITCRKKKTPIPLPKNKQINKVPPAASDCMTSACSGNLLTKKDHNVTYINGKAFFCNPKKRKDGDPFCVNALYTIDDMGLPETMRPPNAPDQNYLYAKGFQPKQGYDIVYCPKNTKPVMVDLLQRPLCCKNPNNNNCDPMSIKSNNENFCLPYEVSKNRSTIPPQFAKISNCGESKKNPTPYMTGDNIFLNPAPGIKQFNDDQKCRDWCLKNPNCTAVVITMSKNMKPLCKYYNNKVKTDKYRVPIERTGFNSYIKYDYPYHETVDGMEPSDKFIADETDGAYTECSHLHNLNKACKNKYGTFFVYDGGDTVNKNCPHPKVQGKCVFDIQNTFIENFDNEKSNISWKPIIIWILLLLFILCVYYKIKKKMIFFI